MRTSAHRAAAGALVGVLIGVSTGCAPNDFAEGKFTAIERSAIKQMRSLDSLHMQGAMRSDGRSMDLDLALDSKGNCTGSVTTGGGTAHFTSSGRSSYIKGSRSFWAANAGGEEAAAQIMTLVGDRWAKLPASSGGLGDMCDLDKVLRDLTKDEPGSKGRKGEQTDVGGVDAVELVYRKGKETTVVWVATEVPHNVLKIETTGGKEPGRLTFSQYNEHVEVDIPTGNQVIDLNDL